mmetsp:Transcript_13655/g.38791  ORF Transcript_13655/g.38791 Transcript_13655/m.38791 type:complete len:256 (-) Transcript_13655:109-876(-)
MARCPQPGQQHEQQVLRPVHQRPLAAPGVRPARVWKVDAAAHRQEHRRAEGEGEGRLHDNPHRRCREFRTAGPQQLHLQVPRAGPGHHGGHVDLRRPAAGGRPGQVGARDVQPRQGALRHRQRPLPALHPGVRHLRVPETHRRKEVHRAGGLQGSARLAGKLQDQPCGRAEQWRAGAGLVPGPGLQGQRGRLRPGGAVPLQGRDDRLGDHGRGPQGALGFQELPLHRQEERFVIGIARPPWHPYTAPPAAYPWHA